MLSVVAGSLPSHTGARAGNARATTALSIFLATAVAAPTLAEPPASATSTPMGCAPPARRDLFVVLIDESGATQQTLDDAKAEAGAIWAGAGLRLAWAAPRVPLDVPDGRPVIVIVRRALLRPASGGAADSRARSHPVLGQVQFGEDGRPGNLIEVSFQALTSFVKTGSYMDRPIVALPAFAQVRLLGRGLGRVVAHEIGHWLMGRDHAHEGLMRPTFGVRDLVESNVPLMLRPWTLARSEPPLAPSSRCDLDASHPASVRQ